MKVQTKVHKKRLNSSFFDVNKDFTVKMDVKTELLSSNKRLTFVN
jgi:hypothetical protein